MKAAAVALVLLLAGFLTGVQFQTMRHDRAALVAARQVEVVAEKKQEAVATVAAAAEVRQVEVRTVFRDREIIKQVEVPYEVIVRDDAKCDVPARVVSMWNSANRAELPDVPGLADESPSGVVLSDIEAQHEREAALCHANTEQLKGLIQAIQEQAAVTGSDQ